MLELDELKVKSLAELREIARSRGIPKYLNLRKAELIERLFVELRHEDATSLIPAIPAPPPKRGRPRKTAIEVPQPDTKPAKNPFYAPLAKMTDTSAQTDGEAAKPARPPAQRGRPRKRDVVPQPDTKPAVYGYPRPIKKVLAKEETAAAQEEKPPVRAIGYEPLSELPAEKTVERNEAKELTPEVPVSDEASVPAEEGQPPVRKRPEGVESVEGILEVMPDGYGFLRFNHYTSSDKDVYVSPIQIRRFNLKTGDRILADVRPKDDENKFRPLLFVHQVNGDDPSVSMRRRPFEALTPIYPDERMRLEVTAGENDYATRLIDLIAPIGKGQRGIIVSPPKAGKTTLLKKIANAISANFPDSELIVLLVDERPEEVTDMQRSIRGDVVFSTFDEQPEHHAKVAELVLERAMRLAEHKRDVVILLDSLTRLTRAYNLIIPPSGRTLTGGIDPSAFYKPKRFFGAARKLEEGGSITILATALVETGSRMDDVIFEEFKGTGNMELRLDRTLQEKRIFPAIDIKRSGTRREEALLSEDELNAAWAIRKLIDGGNTQTVTEELIHMLIKTSNNERLVSQILAVYSKK